MAHRMIQRLAHNLPTSSSTKTIAAAATTTHSLPLSSLTTNKQCQINRNIQPYSTTTTIQQPSQDRHGTTILCVRKSDKVCMMGDGMVSMGSVIVKPNARKIRRITPKRRRRDGATTDATKNNDKNKDDASDNNNNNEDTIVGFAGSTADAFTLLERLEGKIDEYPGQLTRSCVELAKGWRTDKYLRRLEASLIVADADVSLEITGNGDVLESHDGVLGVGSGSPFAIAAARALIQIPELSAEDVARRAMKIASDMCVYTNEQYMVESLDANKAEEDGDEKKEEEKEEEEKDETKDD